MTRDIAGVAEEEKGIYQLLQQANLAASGGEPAQPVSANYADNYTPIRGQREDLTNPGKALQQDIKSILTQNRNV